MGSLAIQKLNIGLGNAIAIRDSSLQEGEDKASEKTQEDNSRARHNVRDPRRFRPEAGSHKAASVESLKLSDDMIRH